MSLLCRYRLTVYVRRTESLRYRFRLPRLEAALEDWLGKDRAKARFSWAPSCLTKYSAFDAADLSGNGVAPINLSGGFDLV